MLLNVCELKPWCGRIGGGSERVVQIRDLLLSLSELRSFFFLGLGCPIAGGPEFYV